MSASVAEMTRAELKQMIDAALEEKLLEILGDPDEGLEIQDAVRDRLLRQKQAVAQGDAGRSFDEVVDQLGLEPS